MKDTTITSLANLFLALSDKTRLRLLGLMSGGEVSVGFLADALGESQPKISRHLAYLRNSGLVQTRRDGKWIYYAIELPADDPTRHVLLETVRSLDDKFDIAGAMPTMARPSVFANDNDFMTSDWQPNELPVYLL